MIENNLVSVIMPVFNAEKYLDESIKSILRQTYENFEFIIINDGSSDRSFDIIEKHAKSDSRIKVINQTNHGLVKSLNKGLSLAKGEFIARMDADDWSHPDRFQEQIDQLTIFQGDICGCNFLVITESGKNLESITVPKSNLEILICLSVTVPFAHGAVMFKSSSLEKHGLVYKDNHAAEDYDLWIRCYTSGLIFVNVDKYLFKYRMHLKSITGGTQSRLFKDAKGLGKSFMNYYRNEIEMAIEELGDKKIPCWNQSILGILITRLIRIRCFSAAFKAFKMLSTEKKSSTFFRLILGR